MSEYKVNANFLINVSAVVEADNEDEAIERGVAEILAKNCDFLDPIDEPEVNWVQLERDDEPDRECYFCGEESCDCDLL